MLFQISIPIDHYFERTLQIQSETLSTLKRIESLLREPTLPRPSRFGESSLLREEEMGLVYQTDLPPNPAEKKDTVSKHLVVKADDNVVLDVQLPFEATVTPEYKVPQDSGVELLLTHVDDAGNESGPAVSRFIAKDTVAPDAPGDFGESRLLREEHDEEVAAEETVVEENPAV